VSVVDYLNSLSQGYWTKPWKRVHSSATNGFIEFQELPEYILWMLPCCVSPIEPHRADCQALSAIQTWNK
jgi:hypothetical protein